ncbi:MAG: serine hydrolase domain-containing protein, partial [Bacteroidota bacterium]
MYQSSNRILFFLALITGAYLFPACNNQAPPQPLEEVEDIELLMSDFQIAGLSVAVIKDFQIEFLEHHGVTDQRQKDDVTASTLFQVGDISKSVTSMAALAFSAEGKIPLTVDINNYLTSWQLEENNNTAIQKVTLGRLLTHTGGINEETFAGYVEGESVPSLFQLLNGQSPANNNPIQVTATPGTQFNYSSGGHLVIQQAMEDVSGTDFASLMKTRIFDPIGMVSSAFEQPLSANKQVVAAS